MRIVVADPGHQVPSYDRALTAALAGRGHEVALATAPLLYYDPGPPGDGVVLRTAFGRLLTFSGGRLTRRPAARRALRLLTYPGELAAFLRSITHQPPDVLHVQWSLVPPLEAGAWRRARAAGVLVVLTAHNVLPHETRPWHRAAYRRLYGAVDGVIVHSEAARERLAGLVGLPASRMAVIPMAADVPLRPAPDRRLERAAARRSLGLPPTAPLALFFGQVRPYKGLDLLLATWGAVRAVLPEAGLLVAGPVAGGRAGIAALRRRIAALGLEGSVTLWPGYVPAWQVDQVFAAADVVALPYRDTEDSAVLQAARGRRRAVVATAVGGLPESLAAGGGLLVPPRSPPDLARALLAVLANPAVRRQLEAEAAAAAAGRTWADVAGETLRAYRIFAARDDGGTRAASADPPAPGTEVRLP